MNSIIVAVTAGIAAPVTAAPGAAFVAHTYNYD